MIDAAADSLRLLAVPAFALAALSDWRYRSIPNEVWAAIAGLGLLALGLDAWAAVNGAPWTPVTNAVIGFLVLAPAAYIGWGQGIFGGADAKAVMVLALALPVAPVELAASSPGGLFVFTVLLNAVVLQIPLTLVAGVLTVTKIRPDAWETMEIPVLVYVFGGVLVGVLYGDVLFTFV